MFITNISLKRPTFAIVVIIAMLAVGIVSYMGLNLNDMPETNIPYVSVAVVLPGASPDQMETKVTKIVEDNIGQLSGVKHITSNISEGYSMTMFEFDDSIDSDNAAQNVRSKISAIRAELPNDIEEPVVSKLNIDEGAIISLAVAGDLGSTKLSNLIENTIVPELNTVSGVGSITKYGLEEREIQIKIDKEKLAAYHLTVDQVTDALRSDNINAPSGKVSNQNHQLTIRTSSSISNVEEFENVRVAMVGKTEIRLGDIAQVIDGHKEKESISYYNGKPCIGIDLVKQSGTNTVEVADNIKNKVEQLQKTLPEGVKISIVTDNSTSIRDSVKGVQKTMVEGCLLAVAIIFLFLRTLGSTAVSAVSLPTSIITTFAAIKIMGFTLNTMSLLALSLSVGLLVDDSIVVIENIVRHLRMGKTPFQAAKEATSEISLAVLATTLTIVAVFLPMSVMKGMIGSFFREFGLTIAFAVLISLFVSFTLVPLMSSKYVKDDEEKEPRTKVGVFLRWFNHQFDTLAISYKKFMTIVLNNRRKTIFITAILFVLSLCTIPVMGISFIPTEDKGVISISAGLDSGLSLDSAEDKAKDIEKIVSKFDDVVSVYTTVQSDNISLNLNLTDKKERKQSLDEMTNQIRSELKKISGLDSSISGSLEGKSYSLHIKGEDFDQLLEYSQQAKQLLATIPGAVDVGINYKAGTPEVKVEVDRNKSADLGVSPNSVSSTLSTLFNGSTVGQYESNGERIDVKASLEDSQSTSLDSISGIYLNSSTIGKMISIEQLTNKVYATASSQLARYDKSRDIQVQANVEGITSSELSGMFMKKLNTELPPPAGITIGVGGDEESMQESIADLVQAMVLGILFIFLILAAQFESWIDPFAIMFSLPLAIIGAMVALFVTGAGLSMIGLIGIIFLMGLVTKNAILLVDFIKQQRENGYERKDAILEAGFVRLRPILMTTLAMILGMMPSAIESGTGSEMRQPMAIAIIGGLISSTLLTLFVIPVIYTILDDIKVKIKNRPRLKQGFSKGE